MTNPDAEERAFDLLQWNPYSLPAEYNDEQALLGLYSKLQKERSDRALDAWDEQHPYKCSDELAGFRELERLGVYTPADFSLQARPKMGTTQNASNSSGIVPESLKDHKELLSRLDQYASTVLCNEEDPLKRLQLLRLYADEVGFPLNERTAALLLSRAAGTIAWRLQAHQKGRATRHVCCPGRGRA